MSAPSPDETGTAALFRNLKAFLVSQIAPHLLEIAILKAEVVDLRSQLQIERKERIRADEVEKKLREKADQDETTARQLADRTETGERQAAIQIEAAARVGGDAAEGAARTVETNARLADVQTVRHLVSSGTGTLHVQGIRFGTQWHVRAEDGSGRHDGHLVFVDTVTVPPNYRYLMFWGRRTDIQ